MRERSRGRSLESFQSHLPFTHSFAVIPYERHEKNDHQVFNRDSEMSATNDAEVYDLMASNSCLTRKTVSLSFIQSMDGMEVILCVDNMHKHSMSFVA